ncbi:MAG: 50S ribosomal protein L10 [Candidatus Moraniibacteriota bacterium]|nr:MAG: 50S ribosomal protein L10 [Candidatus Moranbacteria bacterium]
MISQVCGSSRRFLFNTSTMQQTKQQKEALVAEVADKIKGSKALVFANFKGVSVKNITAIRRELRKSGSSWQVLKKTLLNIALKNAGVEVDARALDGQVGVAFSQDEVAAAKVIADFQKANKDVTLTIEGGALGAKSLTANEVKALAKLPSQDELRAQLVGTLQAPIAGFVRTLSANLSGLVRVLQAVGDAKK